MNILQEALPLEGPNWLQEKRKHAWNQFSESEQLPFFRYGLSITTPLEGVEPTTITREGNESIVTGVASRKPTPQVFDLLPSDRFASLHKAFTTNFLTIKIPDNTILKDPLVIDHLMNATTFFHHLEIVVGKNCTLSILESVKGRGAFHSGGVEINIGQGSSLVYGSAQHLDSTTKNIQFRNAHVGQDAKLEWIMIDTGSKLTISRIDGRMDGRGSQLITKMMVFGTGNQHFDFDVASIHGAPNTH